jgi:hypothetical protein
MNNKFTIFAFRAIDEPELCSQYIDGHVRVLTHYGITNVTTNNNSWINNPHIYCVVAQDNQSKELVGGVRIQIAEGIHSLPVEKAIGNMDETIYDKVNSYALNGGIGESCGLWISNSVKNLGISRYLMWGSISSAIQLNFATMLGICAGYTLRLFGDLGFVIDKSLGENGDFPYPNENYIAHVIGILNAITIETATHIDKKVMLSLRENPIQTRIENNKGFESIISYDLIYENISELNYNLKDNTIL